MSKADQQTETNGKKTYPKDSPIKQMKKTTDTQGLENRPECNAESTMMTKAYSVVKLQI